MRQAVLLGSPDTKRTIYLQKAAVQEGLPVVFVNWKEWKEWFCQHRTESVFVKIDPPLWSSCSLEQLNKLVDNYVRQLMELDQLAQSQKIVFLNKPSVIAELLDKQICKIRLQQAGLPVTETVWMPLGSDEKLTVELLFDKMRRQRIHQVFIKPVRGSGAAGVSALRWQPRTGQMALYTCALLQPDATLVNTKRLRRFCEPKEIVVLLSRILDLNCIVERWYAKAEYQGCSYDLRAVVQDGKLDFLLGRLSKGPITNLHLNNQPLEIAELGLPAHTLSATSTLCRKSMEVYAGLRSAGIDILLEKGSMKPRIIEMNAQGDLIYQSIYQQNSIYRHQAQMMRAWMQIGECENE